MLTCYAPELAPAQTSHTLSEDESKHAVRVLRLVAGDAVELIDGRGGRYAATIAEANPKQPMSKCRPAPTSPTWP